ncbi:hypothetical protein MIMGU_mgv1a015150mg [Erythranthe guttata]|uniref:Uncharacterized protein n=1 Tax=Erythranthe guttata TaxID=4155 RepID=A0A022QD74_ERYGU|nr:hypothetical protein MIMGU_mgv1a015150mg [Erythranthe guttata]
MVSRFLHLHFHTTISITLISIPISTQKKISEIQRTQNRIKVIKIIQPPLIEILRQPAPAPISIEGFDHIENSKFLHELLGVRQPRIDRLGRFIVEKAEPRLLRQLQPPLLGGSHRYLDQTSHGAAVRPHFHIHFFAHKEQYTRQKHKYCGNGQAYGPANVGLNIND